MNKIEFDENKEYSLEELKQMRDSIWDIRCSILNKITQLEIENYNYEGKYIYYSGYGYMYVTWQKYYRGDSRMFFQGIAFKGSFTEYRDDTMFYFDAMQEWYIPIETFKEDVANGKIKEITKDEYLEIVKNYTDALYGEIERWANLKLNK